MLLVSIPLSVSVIWSVQKNYVPLHPHSTKQGSVLSKISVRDLAQLVAHTSGGREVAGSSPVIPTESERVERFSRFSFISLVLAGFAW